MQNWQGLEVFFDLPSKEQQLTKLEQQLNQPTFWDDHETAQKVLKEKAAISGQIKTFQNAEVKLTDIQDLLNLGVEENDEEIISDAGNDMEKICKELASLEVKLTLSGKYDSGNGIITVHPGAGGTESQDWAEMLFRMYSRFAEKNGWKTEILDYQDGDEAGLKSVTMAVRGEYAYGYLKSEVGVHRLVRISPFDANKRRHTSFAALQLLPELADDVAIEINDGDLRVDTYRASGAGGQHVNKTDSAIRITHAPTGIVVQCQSERSQHKNRATAMKLLKAKLIMQEEQKKRDEVSSIHADKKEIGWGSQIRSYVLQPYRMVKDSRTGIETSNTDAVLDGEIMQFIEGFLISDGNSDQKGA